MTLDPRQIARALGGECQGRSVSAPGPGHSPKDRSLSIKVDARASGGFIVFSHAGDDPIRCRDYVRERLGLEPWRPGDRQPVVSVQVNDTASGRTTEWAAMIWRAAIDPRGTVVERYLNGRGIQLRDDIAGPVLRFHPRLKYMAGETSTWTPGMVALFRDMKTGEAVAIHRTFLTGDGVKLDKRMLGPVKGAAIRLSTIAQDGHLVIGEGIETCLAAQAAGVGPTWAVGSTAAVRLFPVLRGVRELTLLQERDDVSPKDVKRCAKRWLNAGRPVNIVTPAIGKDFADAWAVRARA